MQINSKAGKLLMPSELTDIPKLITAYYTHVPDVHVPSQKVSFGTSGHRGSSFQYSFNERHILAITQAVCLYRLKEQINGPLFLGFDTHALSVPAFATAMEVLAANAVQVMIADGDEFTPTPVISRATLNYNAGRKSGFADGIVLTPSHNPPDEGGFKYNPPNGGPAGNSVTEWIENKANELLSNELRDIKRITFNKAMVAGSTRRIDLLTHYINGLDTVINMDVIRNSNIHIGVDPLGGAGVHYWDRIAQKYQLNLTVISRVVDPTFSFMTADWDGKIRMDPSSSYAMQRLIAMKDNFDISFACDTDHDRHGIVTKSAGLLNPNHYLSVAINYLLQNRPQWPHSASVGKTAATTALIDRIASKLKRKVYEVPVGFKYFVEGLLDSTLCFGGEESAGASFSHLDGKVWTTDKDAFIPSLLAAEITALTGKDPGILYSGLTEIFGTPYYNRIEAAATTAQKEAIKRIVPDQIQQKYIAGEAITSITTHAAGNDEAIGGIKVSTENGWFAIRPSGTEELYKIYAESFVGETHLNQIIKEAQELLGPSLLDTNEESK
jgi:phosphoglucomutase